MDMACFCRAKVEKLVCEQTGDPMAKLRGMIIIDKEGAQFRPTIATVYRKKKKDGSFCKTESELEISYEYCPFCGRKLKEDDNIEKGE